MLKRMLLKFSIAVILIAQLGCLAQEEEEDEGWPKMADGHSSFFQWLGQHPQIMADASRAMLELKGLTPDLLSVNEPSPNGPLNCDQCVYLAKTLKTAIRLGLTFEDIRPIAVGVCYQLLTPIAGPVICPGIIDNYGPHVLYIVEHAEETATEMCIFYGECNEADEQVVPEYKIYAQLSQRLKHIWEKTRHSSDHGQKKREAKDLKENTIKVAMLSDIHVDHLYSVGSAVECGLPTCCRDTWPGEGSAGQWGTYACNSPTWTTELMLQALGDLNPDLIIYSGDDPAHTPWEDTKESHMNVTRWIAESIAKFVPGVPAFVTMGNHDIHPTNLYYVPREDGVVQEMNQAFFDTYTALAGFTSEQEETILHSGYYTILAQPGLRILSMNTNYAQSNNWYDILSKDEVYYPEMKAFVETTMQQARENGEKVIIMGHHGGGDNDWRYFREGISLEYSDIIVFESQGHSHKDKFSVAIDHTTGEPKGVRYTGPSFQPRKKSNPAFRMFYLDQETFQPLDYIVYYLDLEASEGNDNPEVSVLYQATVDYGVADISPSSMLDLTYRFEDDDELWQLYNANILSQSPYVEPCTGSCKEEGICNTRAVTGDGYQLCMASTRLILEHRNMEPVEAVAAHSPSGFNLNVVAACCMILVNLVMHA